MLLEPRLADDRVVSVSLKPLLGDVLLTDQADGPQDVRQRGPEWVVTPERLLQADPRELTYALGQRDAQVVLDVRLEHHRLIGGPLVAAHHQRAQTRLGLADRPGELVQRPGALLGDLRLLVCADDEVLRKGHDVPGLAAARQNLAVAVEDLSAGSGDVDGADAVADGSCLKAACADDLQEPQPYDENREQRHHDAAEQRDAFRRVQVHRVAATPGPARPQHLGQSRGAHHARRTNQGSTSRGVPSNRRAAHHAGHATSIENTRCGTVR